MPRRASLLALGALLLACNSDDTFGATDAPDTTGELSSTTLLPTTSTSSSTTTTGEPETTTSTSGMAPTTGEPPPPPPTCEDLLDCVLPCALQFDLQCAQMCAEGLPPEEAAEAFQLGLCIGMACFESGACSTDDLMNPVCLACIGFLLMDDTPAGCEEEAAACAS